MAIPIFDEKGTKVNPNSNEFYDFDPGDWSNFYQKTSPQPIGNTTQPVSPGEGFAWFGEPGGEGRWSIDTESDYWNKLPKFKEPMPNTGVKGGPNLPGWFQGSFDPETGRAYGSNYSGGRGWLSEGGDLTAEHYGQPGSWSWTPELRPDGSTAHVVGDVYWDGDLGEGTPQEGPAYYSDDPDYQEQILEQKGRMRSKIMDKILEGDEYAPQELLSWDRMYGQKDLAGGKHFTQDIEAEAAATTRQQQLRQQKEGVVRGTLETDRADTGPTLAERLNPQASQRVLRGIRDELRGDLIDNKAVTGLPSFDKAGNPIVFDPNFQGKEGWKITKNLPESIRPDAKGYGAALDDIGTARMYQDIGTKTRGTPFGTKDGQFILRDIPEQTRIDRMSWKNPLGSKISRGFTGASEVQLPHGTPGRLTSADEVAELAIKASAGKGGKKLAARAIPFVGTGLGAWDVGSRLMEKDYAGAALGAISMIPGPVGWAGLAGQVTHDAGDGDIAQGVLNIKDILTPSGPIKGRETGSQRRARQKKARGSTYNQALDRNVLTIAGKGGSPGQPYDAPKEDPNNPYVPAPKRFTV